MICFILETLHRAFLPQSVRFFDNESILKFHNHTAESPDNIGDSLASSVKIIYRDSANHGKRERVELLSTTLTAAGKRVYIT